MDFSFWEIMKDNVYISWILEELQELCNGIVIAIAVIDVTFLNKL
jgi:hypothetical protein